MSYNEQRIYKAFEDQGYNTKDILVEFYTLANIKGWYSRNIWDHRGALFATYLGPNITRVLHNIKIGRARPPVT